MPALMYFGYMTIASATFFCLTGTIGFYATYVVRAEGGGGKVVCGGGGGGGVCGGKGACV